MNLSFPAGASVKEIEAIVERGFDAMYDAYNTGDQADIAFYPAEKKEKEEVGLENNESDNDNKNGIEEGRKKARMKMKVFSKLRIHVPNVGQIPASLACMMNCS
jgi:hypothetical protein